MTRGDAPDWRENSKCKNLTAKQADSLFFPPPGGKSKKAEEYCRTCPVIKECLLNLALSPGTVGFFAGTTENERKEMRKFVASIPTPISDTLPKEPTRKTRRLRSIPKTDTDLPIDKIEGPSFMDELKMLA